MWCVASIIIIITIIDAHYEVALGQPIDCRVKCTKDRFGQSSAGTQMDRHGMPPSASHVLDYRSGKIPKEV